MKGYEREGKKGRKRETQEKMEENINKRQEKGKED